MIFPSGFEDNRSGSEAKEPLSGTPSNPSSPMGPVIDSFFELHKAIGEHKTTEIPINLLMSLRKLANGISPQEILSGRHRKSDENEPDNRELIAHLQRVAAYAELLAIKAGLSESEARLVKQISPMHDIGKLAIPEHILQKSSELTPAEWEIMKTHTEVGYALLKDCQLEVLQMGALVAKQHQEKFDGSGYPLGLKGEAIHLYSRITTVADVFDALGSKRSYKEAWPIEDIVAYFKAGRGSHFDPVLVDLLMANLDEFVAISHLSRV